MPKEHYPFEFGRADGMAKVFTEFLNLEVGEDAYKVARRDGRAERTDKGERHAG